MQLGALEYLISLNSNNLDKDIKKADNKLTSWAVAKGQMISRVMEKAMATAGDSMKKVLGGAFNSYADYEQLVGGVDTLFKDSSKKLQQYAAVAYKTVGVSANQYMESVTSFSASLLQSLGGDTDKAADVADMAMKDMADNMNKMGSSMESIQNAYQGFAKQNYTMLDNLKLGYGGTKSEMQRLLKDATKLTGQKYDIKNLSDVYQAIHAIQEEMGITGTTAKEAEETIAGSMNSAKAAWQDMLTSFGTGKNVREATQRFADSAKTVIKNATPVISEALKSMITAAKTIWPSVKDAVKDIWKNVESTVKGLTPKGIRLVLGIGSRIIKRLTQAFKKDGLKGILKETKNIIKDIAKGTKTGLAKVLNLDNPDTASWLDIGKELAEKVKQGAAKLVNKGKNTLTEWLGLRKDASWFDIGRSLFEFVRDGAKSLIENGKNLLTDWLGLSEDDSWIEIGKGLFNKVRDGAKSLLEDGKNLVTDWMGLAEDASWVDIGTGLFNRVRDGAKSLVEEGKNNITDWLKLEKDASWYDIGSALTRRVKIGAKQVLDKGKNAITSWLGLEEDATWSDIGNGLGKKIKAGFEEAKVSVAGLLGLSEGATWSDIGKEIVGGLFERFKNSGGWIKELITGDSKSSWVEVGNTIWKWLEEAFEGKDLIGTILENTVDKIDGVMNIVTKIIDKIAEWLDNTDNVTKFVTALTGLLSSVAKSASKLIKPLLDIINAILGDKDFWDSIGDLAGQILIAFAKAITNKEVWDNLISAVSALLDGVLRAVLGDNAYNWFFGDKKSLADIIGFWTKSPEDKEKEAEEREAKRRAQMKDSEYFLTKEQENINQAILTEALRRIAKDRGDNSAENVGKYKEGVIKDWLERGYLLQGENGAIRYTDEDRKKLAEKLGLSDVPVTPTLSDDAEQQMQSGLNGMDLSVPVTPVIKWIDSWFSGKKQAKGNWNVPYDNYPSLLHRGEMVLTKSQARQYRDGEGDGMNYAVAGSMIGRAVEKAMSRVYVMMSGEKVGDLTTRRVRNNMNASSYRKLRALGG